MSQRTSRSLAVRQVAGLSVSKDSVLGLIWIITAFVTRHDELFLDIWVDLESGSSHLSTADLYLGRVEMLALPLGEAGSLDIACEAGLGSGGRRHKWLLSGSNVVKAGHGAHGPPKAIVQMQVRGRVCTGLSAHCSALTDTGKVEGGWARHHGDSEIDRAKAITRFQGWLSRFPLVRPVKVLNTGCSCLATHG